MKITIDGRSIELKEKKTILAAARENEIYIPSLCDHPRLEPFGGCRLCLVEVKGRKGYVPACATAAEDGMDILTATSDLLDMRRRILELILTEHPNACLICSEKEMCDDHKATIRKVGEVTGCVLCSNNGQCELQDVVDALKIENIPFPSVYRNFDIRKNDPFFDRNYNLCILCGRCVRVCHEVRGASAISFVFRGTQAVIGTSFDKPLLESGCQFCGACTDVCPTGALVERAVRPDALPEENKEIICPLCSLGCTLTVGLKGGRIVCSLPSEDGPVNKGQGCVKGRFAVRDVVHSSKRIAKPMIRIDGKLSETTWEETLAYVAERLAKYKNKDVAFISSPQVTEEETFVFYKFARDVLKTEQIDGAASFSPHAALWDSMNRNGIAPEWNFSFQEIARAKAILLIGAEVPVSHPVIWLEILKAVRKGAELLTVTTRETPLRRFSSVFLRVHPGTEISVLGCLLNIVLESEHGQGFSHLDGYKKLKNSTEEFSLSQAAEISGVKEDDLKKVARTLLEVKPSVILFGPGVTHIPGGRQCIDFLWNMASVSRAKLIPLSSESNLRGEIEIRRRFLGKGMSFPQIVASARTGKVKALYAAGPLPYLEKSGLEFLAIQDCYDNGNLPFADAVLPATTFAEKEGTYINAEGRIQHSKKIIEPLGEAKPDWWILAQIAKRLGVKGFDYEKSSDILDELSQVLPGFEGINSRSLKRDEEFFLKEERKAEACLIPSVAGLSPIRTTEDFPFLLVGDYGHDYYRGLDLSEEITGMRRIRNSRWICISPNDADRLNVSHGEKIRVESSSGRITALARITEAIPDHIVVGNFVLNGDAEFSPARLFPSFSNNPDSQFMTIEPVRIAREE